MSNYQLGPAAISLDTVDLGKTHGGITVAVEETVAPLTTDQDGSEPVDEVITGTKVTITGSLAEIALENFGQFLKQTVVGASGSSQKVEVTTNVGTSLLVNAVEAVVKPYVGGIVTADANKWIALHQAGLKTNASIAYNASDQRVLGFTMTGYADSNGLIATFGDIAAI